MNVSSKQVFFGTILCILARCSFSFSSRLYGRTIPKDVRDPFCGTRIRKHDCVVMFNSLEDKKSEIDSHAMLNFPDSIILEIGLEDHKPLGCTAEECLDVLEIENGAKHVFISKIVEGGNAEKAGIELGDLIIGVSSMFGDSLENVNGVGLDRVKSLVAGCDKEQNLNLRIARGTDVMSRHEKVLVDLCTLSDNGIEATTQACLDALYSDGYELLDDVEEICEDDGSECMLDTMYNIWDEEMSETIDKEEEEEKEEEAPPKKKPYPWASRSSPSGTFVRDPKTGKMVNIDA